MQSSERQLRLLLSREFATLGSAVTPSTLDHRMLQHEVWLNLILGRSIQNVMSALGHRAVSSLKKSSPWLLERKLVTEEQLAERTAAWVRKYAAKKAVGIAHRTRERIQEAIAAGMDAGEGQEGVQRRIREECDDMAIGRARTIARTETHTAGMVGQNDAMEAASEELGITMDKVWIASDDERTRETHLAADGQTVAMSEVFTVGESSLSFPGDPSGPPEEIINCRCVVGYEPH